VAVEALRSLGAPPLPPREIEAHVAPFRADRALVQKVAYDMSLESPAVAVPSLQALLATDLTPLLPQIHVPVYVINSDLAPTDVARIRRALPGTTVDVLEHSDHFLMLEDPARFNPLLLKDLAALAAGASPH
jgi:pimeloyl-ACP methyl ester carboxylesterase